MDSINFNLGEKDPLLDQARQIIGNAGSASATRLQRELNIGFARAGRIIEELERQRQESFSEPTPRPAPPLECLLPTTDNFMMPSSQMLKAVAQKLTEVLEACGVGVADIKVVYGYSYHLFKVYVTPGTKVSKVRERADDIAVGIGVEGVRITVLEDCIGVEIPIGERRRIGMRELLTGPEATKHHSTMTLPLFLGKDINHRTFAIDLAKAPHILIAGAAGQGKSQIVDTMICSLLYSDKDVKFLLIDPNEGMVEWRNLPEEFFFEARRDVVSAEEALAALRSLHAELESRYDTLSREKVKNIADFQKKGGVMGYILCVMDEFAQYVRCCPDKGIRREVQKEMVFLASKGRAVGIHLVLTTQRPSVDAISGIIKANFPVRIAVRTVSAVDSIVILDIPGAEKLTGQGDMLLSQGAKLTRVQAAEISESEKEKILGITN